MTTRQDNIRKAVKLLKSGELVAFPTETVYGLGADATNPDAVKKIFKAKNRPLNHPVIVHIYHQDQLKHWVKSIPIAAKKLIQHFWPGPLTLIFKTKKSVSTLITGDQKTIGIRMPSHPIARELLKNFGAAIAAPSANRFGKISPTKAIHVQEELGDRVSLILDGGDCDLGIESTIIDMTHRPPRLLRPGPLDVDQIKKISDVKIIYNNKDIPRVSGNLPSHYSPTTPLYLFGYKKLPSLRGGQGPTKQSSKMQNIAVISFRTKPKNFSSLWIRMPLDSVLYAHKLYATLRKLDTKNLDSIYLEMPPDEITWEAIRDRLIRASAS